MLKAVTFKTSRSGGKGGQNVNKVSSKVMLVLTVSALDVLNEAQKERLLSRLNNRIDADGNLQVVVQEDRSQVVNKKKALERLEILVNEALKVPKPRKETKISSGEKLKRKWDKRQRALKKQFRQKPILD